MWPFLAGLATAAVPGIASAFGQERANRANVKLTREGMAFEADQVAKQMQFQERMSGTAYQRAVEDMRLAGINPMLAYMQGGASTPGGGAASGAAATVQDVAGPAVASAQHARRLNEELRNMRTTRETTWAQGEAYKAAARSSQSQAHLNVASELESQARAENTRVNTELSRLAIPQARVAAEQYRGRFGTAFGVLDRLFGGRTLAPIGLRR